MGGLGSGSWSRWDKTTKVKECHRLDIRDFKRCNALEPGPTRKWEWNCNGEPSGSIHYQVINDHRMTISYTYNGNPHEEDIELLTTPCNYGGYRYWFACPHCTDRVGVLILYGGAFRCRKCHRLSYESENYSNLDRLCNKRDKVMARLGSGQRLHKRTREKLYRRLIELDKRCEAEFVKEAIKFSELTELGKL